MSEMCRNAEDASAAANPCEAPHSQGLTLEFLPIGGRGVRIHVSEPAGNSICRRRGIARLHLPQLGTYQ
jgi:hypothetical protein